MLIFQVYLNIHSHFPGPFPASKRFWGSQSPESVWNCDQHWPVSNGFWVSGIHPSNKKHHITVWRSDLILPRKLLAFKRYLFIRIRPVKSWPCLDPQGGPFWALRCLSDLHLVNQKVRYCLWRGKGLSVGMILREKGKLDRVSQGGRLRVYTCLGLSQKNLSKTWFDIYSQLSPLGCPIKLIFKNLFPGSPSPQFKQ